MGVAMSVGNSQTNTKWPGTVGVVSRLPRGHGPSPRPWVCLRIPDVGEQLVLFDGRPGTHLVTSRVVRIFEAGTVLYVQTSNSVYRVALVSSDEIERREDLGEFARDLTDALQSADS